MYDLTRENNPVKFGQLELDSMMYLKTKLIETPILTINDAHLETKLHCDASSHGFGETLMQKSKDLKIHPTF